jgi:hypothetical protein
MTATPDTVPSDLALEIGDDLSPERFVAAARAFFGYVNEISQALAPSGEHLRWTVKVREGSALLGVVPAAATDPQLVQSIYAKAENGVRWLASGNIDQSGLPEPAIKHLRALSELTEGQRGALLNVRLWIKRVPVDVDAGIAEVVRQDWRTDYKDFGTVEGRLETIQDRDGTLLLQIRDSMLRQTIRCYFPEEMLAEAFSSFRKRVEIGGLVHYRKNGTPVSIEARHIERLPEEIMSPGVV